MSNRQKCPYCGTSLPKDSLFCKRCRAKLEQQEDISQAPTQELWPADEGAPAPSSPFSHLPPSAILWAGIGIACLIPILIVCVFVFRGDNQNSAPRKKETGFPSSQWEVTSGLPSSEGESADSGPAPGFSSQQGFGEETSSLQSGVSAEQFIGLTFASLKDALGGRYETDPIGGMRLAVYNREKYPDFLFVFHMSDFEGDLQEDLLPNDNNLVHEVQVSGKAWLLPGVPAGITLREAAATKDFSSLSSLEWNELGDYYALRAEAEGYTIIYRFQGTGEEEPSFLAELSQK